MRWILSLLVLACFSSQAEIVVEDAWIREGPPGNRMMAGYMRLTNTGERAITLKGARAEAFAAISMHESIEADGVSRMVEVDPIRLAPGQTVSFSPGGLHLMLMGPVMPLRAGDSCPIELEFNGRHVQLVEFDVRGLD